MTIWRSKLMAMLVVFKLVAVTTSYGSGNAGGIFGPSLFIGAMLGGTLGSVAHHLWPAYTAQPGSLRAGGNGRAVRGYRARADDFCGDDFRDDARLRGDRPADDCESGELLPFFPPAEGADLRGAGDSGWHPFAERRGAQAARPTTSGAGDARRHRIASGADDRATRHSRTTRGSQLHAWPVTDERGVVGVVSRAQIEQAMAKGEEMRNLGRLRRRPRFSARARGPSAPCGAGTHGRGETGSPAGREPGEHPLPVGDRGRCQMCCRRLASTIALRSGDPQSGE